MTYLSEILLVFAAALLFCMYRTYKSSRPIARDVLKLLFCIFIPLIGNGILITTSDELTCRAAYVLYFIGTDLLLLYLVRFVFTYCGYKKKGNAVMIALVGITIADCISIFLNPMLHHVFEVELIRLQTGEYYCALVSLWYHKVHLGLSLLMVLVVALVFMSKFLTTPKAFWKKYVFIFATIIITSVWEGYYILLNRPVDIAMIGYALCGIVIYYYTIEYTSDALIEKMKSTIVETVSDGILFFDKGGECIYANIRAQFLLNIRKGKYDGVKDTIFKMLSIDEDSIDDVNSLETRRAIENDGEMRTYDIEYHKISDGQGHWIGAFAILSDRTEEIERINKEHFMATHDLLTGIYNADNFYEKVRRRLDDDPKTEYMVVASDIKEFKLINDRYGREKGDELLTVIAETLRRLAGTYTIYGRIGSDRFGVLIRKQDYSQEIFEKGINEIPVSIIDSQFPVIIHVGVYEITDRSTSVSVMFDRCFIAIAGIKNDLDKRIAYYDDKVRSDLLWEQRIAGELDDAIASGQIVPYLQAQVSSRDGRIKGAEVLVRWLHPTEGFMSPGKFIPLFEKNGMIVKVDMYMWECACRILKHWSEQGRDDLYLSVNISPKDFYLVDVPETVIGLTKKYGIEPSRLRLEITESIMMDDADKKIKTIEKLRENGFIVEVDDFGSGYSSLNMLKDMPVDVLKLDMVFLNDSTHSDRTRKIMKLIIDLAKDLDVPVIAEGVETVEQVDFLTEMGCDFFQGYYFSKPISLDDYEKKLA